MAGRVGRKIKFRWGTPPAEIPGVREKGVTLNGEAVDVTGDDSDGWRELLARHSIPFSALPAVVLTRISGGPLYADDGEVGLEQARIQVDCWAETYAAAKLLARAVAACLSAFEGTVGATVFQFIELDIEQDLREGGGNAAAYPFRTALDFLVWAER